MALTALLVFALAGCDDPSEGERFEGSEPGDCDDGADNDRDGDFDCDDTGCEGAPACDGAGFDGGGTPTDGGGPPADGSMPGLDGSMPGLDGSMPGLDGSMPGLDGSMPGLDGGPGSYTFPPRDFTCGGATPPCATNVPVRSAAQRTVTLPAPTGAPETAFYLFGTLAMPPATGSTAAGFNLDALDSGDGSTAGGRCDEYEGDFLSLRDPLHGAVDNTYESLVTTTESLLDPGTCPGGVTDGCLDVTLQRQINDGTLLLGLEVSGIDSYQYDPQVSVTLYELSTTSVQVDLGTGRPVPGQTFDTVTILGSPVTGDIFEGRLRVLLSSLPLYSGGGGLLFIADLTEIELRADIQPDALTAGQLGGLMSVEGLVAAAVAIDPSFESTVRAVVEGMADVDPGPDPSICRSLSMGLTFEGITAVRRP